MERKSLKNAQILKKDNHSPDESQIIDFQVETPYSLLMGISTKTAAPLILFCVFWACGPGGGNESHPPPEGFAPVYAEMLIWATDTDSLGASGGSARAAQDSILASSGMTREDFNATVEWYNRDVTRWGNLLENVVRYLEEKSRPREENDTPQNPAQPAATQLS
jgi:hypothetical protein